MDIIKKKTIYLLSENFVEIDEEQFIIISDQEIRLDIPKHRTLYINSSSKRAALTAEQPANIVSAVFAIWGNEPTVVEEEKEVEEK